MIINNRIASVALAISAIAGCSSSEPQPPMGQIDASDGAVQSDDARSEGPASSCDPNDPAKPQMCLLGGPCSCSDIASDNRLPICVAGGWQCPEGYTRFEDCRGVPSRCDGGSVPDSGGGPAEDADARSDPETGDARDAGLRCDGRPADAGRTGVCDPGYDPACLLAECAAGLDAYLARSCQDFPFFMEIFEHDCNLVRVHTFVRECVFDATSRKLVGSRSWSDTHDHCAGVAVPSGCPVQICHRVCSTSMSPWDAPTCPAGGRPPGGEAGIDGGDDASGATDSSSPIDSSDESTD